MGRHLFFVIALSLIAANAAGQSGQSPASGDVLQYLQNGGKDGDVYLRADSLLVANYYKLLAQNRSVTGVPGYRIRIYSGSGLGAKEEQQRIRARFLSLFPEIDAYHRYDEPYFKVYVGDCRTMSEAIKLYDVIEDDFPNLFIVPDQINLKNKEQDTP
jgi:hypothetical protein